jgi:hypothetical protein
MMPHPAAPETIVNNVNPDPPVLKPSTLKYVAPSHFLKEAGNPTSPKLEKHSSIGQGGTIFSKPNLSHSKSQGGNTIINNYYFNNNIQVNTFPSIFPQGGPQILNMAGSLNAQKVKEAGNKNTTNGKEQESGQNK